TSATRRRCPATVSLKDRGEGDCSNVAVSDSSQSRSTPNGFPDRLMLHCK
ncbi:hypothetical protein BCR44DRAFT_1434828, partial [Catenaria anguillulae PL171]